jgi:transposase InsO family protein
LVLLAFGFVILELSAMEQRYQAVLEVAAGVPVVEVAERFGVSRQAVHRWVGRYRAEGLEGLADRSHRPKSSPWQVGAEVEALVCEMRRMHPRWGPRRLRAELARRGVDPVPHRSSIYRILVRFGLVAVRPRRKRRSEYKRWQRDAPMELWQLDIVGSCFLTDGRQLKVVTGVDDHSRYCVIAAVVPRATSRAVCAAFVQALSRFGCPEQVLTDNGKQFTGRFGKPRPAEVLFERICRRNGIRTILTKPRSPTTTGKVERFHQTLQGDCFAVHGAFPDLPAAQQAVDAFVAEYNHHRPHQALDDQVPASRFAPIPAEQRHLLGLDVPAELVDSPPAPPEANAVGTPPPMLDPDPGQVAEAEDTHGFLTAAEHWLGGEAIEVDRVVPASGNLAVGGQQFWIGTVHAGHQVRLWMDTTTVHLTLVDSVGGAHLKTIPSRQTTVTLARLRADGARPAGPPPVPAVAARATGPSAAIEIDRVVNANGLVGIAGRYVSVGQPLAGRRITLRIDGNLAHVIDGGVLVRTIPAPVPAERRGRLRGARLAAAAPAASPHPITVQRRVSAAGLTQVAGQTLRVGHAHRNTLVDVEAHDGEFHVYDLAGEPLTVIPRTSSKEISRFKAYGWKHRVG